jgi:fibronectin-binding autotransporter adhesin
VSVTFNTPVKGPGDLLILGDAVVTLAGTGNTLPGVDFSANGTLRVGSPNALATAWVNVPLGATFDVNNSATDVLGLHGPGAVTLGTGSPTVKNTLPSTFTGTIGGGAGSILIKDGPGTLTLGGANTFTIGPQIIAGTLRVTHPNALGAGDGTQGTGTLVLAGATLALDGVALANERIHLGGETQPAIL